MALLCVFLLFHLAVVAHFCSVSTDAAFGEGVLEMSAAASVAITVTRLNSVHNDRNELGDGCRGCQIRTNNGQSTRTE